MANYALINPHIISWARARARLSEGVLSKYVGVKIEKLMAWESGEKKPTFSQAQKLATRMYIPFAYLFLSAPPVESVPIPDLRTQGSHELKEFSVDLLDTIRSVMQKQAWYKDYLMEQEAESLTFIGSHNLDSYPVVVAEDIRYVLSLMNLDPKGLSWIEYQKRIVSAAEEVGILVMWSGVAGNNNRRILDVSEFRGFAISDRYAPVVFVNWRDAPSARLFTLLHEIAHLWIGKSGISAVGVNESQKAEKFCNAVAGEFLVPTSIMEAEWSRYGEKLLQNIPKIAKLCHVSDYVVVRRALDLGFIDRNEYSDYYQKLLEEFKKQKGGGGNYYTTARNRNSALFSKALMREALSGRVLLRDAGRLLDMAPSKLETYAKTIGA